MPRLDQGPQSGQRGYAAGTRAVNPTVTKFRNRPASDSRRRSPRPCLAVAGGLFEPQRLIACSSQQFRASLRWHARRGRPRFWSRFLRSALDTRLQVPEVFGPPSVSIPRIAPNSFVKAGTARCRLAVKRARTVRQVTKGSGTDPACHAAGLGQVMANKLLCKTVIID